MRLVGRDVLEAFWENHPDSRIALETWIKAIEEKEFQHFVALKGIFGAADYVKPHVVFDIGGNKYRLIASVNYEFGTVRVRAMLTHADYDRGNWRP